MLMLFFFCIECIECIPVQQLQHVSKSQLKPPHPGGKVDPAALVLRSEAMSPAVFTVCCVCCGEILWMPRIFLFLPWLLKGFAHISPIPLLIRFFWAAPAIIDICQSHVLSSLAMTSLIHPDTDSHTVVSKSSRVLSHTASRQKLHLHMWTLFLWIFTLPNRWLWAF